MCMKLQGENNSKKFSPNGLSDPNHVEHLWVLSRAMKGTCVGQWSPDTLLLVSASIDMFMETRA